MAGNKNKQPKAPAGEKINDKGGNKAGEKSNNKGSAKGRQGDHEHNKLKPATSINVRHILVSPIIFSEIS